MKTVYFLGIDIAKKKFDGALTVDGKNFHPIEAENASKPIQALFSDLKKKFSISYDQLVVCMEHTGIYCRPLLEFLIGNQIQVCVESAFQIKQSQGLVRGKTDKIDAQRIALYAYKNRESLKFWTPQRLIIQKLKALLVTRERLVKVKTELQGPIKECEEFIEESLYKAIAKSCQSSIKSLKNDIQKIEKTIDALVKSDTEIDRQYQLVTSVTGLGKITGLNIIVSTAEFTRIKDAKKFACYSGVAPFEHSSGSSVRGKTRVSKMANMTLKKLLHMAAMTAMVHDDDLKTYYHRKVLEGKNKMSVINAVRNKLISRVFACVNNNRLYQKNYQNALA
ncbi:IS110 family transposase [Chryseolinea lacunae]|uniref:IS110 family transposase n=1 Tax=Chryseolinea lacunae TaxID=2801331 RepID=A0ABS1KY93_9BACT|nr:IS110 family transposase [Chryseolinea lacunae]MBL0744419.1 IS110 family transposase [Chryseolinea lacunae]